MDSVLSETPVPSHKKLKSNNNSIDEQMFYGRDISVGIATLYGLDASGFELR
jgi:hypothetical protein